MELHHNLAVVFFRLSGPRGRTIMELHYQVACIHAYVGVVSFRLFDRFLCKFF